jgi:PAS domain S-box-containing protein
MNQSSYESNEFDRNFLDNMLEGCQIIGHDWRYIYLNTVAELHNRRPNQELVGKLYMEMWPGIEDTQVFAEIKRCMEEQIVTRLENRFVYPDGEMGWFRLSIQPVPKGVFILSVDITERKRAEEILRQAQERLESILASVTDIYILFDKQWRYLYVNDAAVHAMSRPRDQILGHILWELYPDIIGTELDHAYRRAMDERVLDANESYYLTLDTWWQNRFYPVPEGLAVFATDITERKRTEEALRRSQETSQNLFENNPHPMWVYDTDTLAFLMVNDAAVKQYGYSREEFRGMTIKDIRPKEVVPALLDNLAQNRSLLHKSKGWQHCKKDGTSIDVEITSHALQFENRPARLVLANDITERKKAEEYIRYQASLLENVSDAIIASDMNTRITSWNPAAEEIYGWRAEEVIGRPVNHFLQTEYNEPTTEEQVFQQFLEQGLWRGEVTRKRKDGTKITILASVSLMRDEANAPVAMVAINRDITARKRAEEQLQTLNAELEQRVVERTMELNRINAELERANRAKDEFLATMSHELRTPLNSILGLSESLLEQRRGSLNEHQQNSLHLIESSGHHLLELINDILDLSKIEAGKFDFYPELVTLEEVCKSSLAFIKIQAAKKSIKVTYTNESFVSQVYADSRRLKQILVNLLTNAVKFTHENGCVTLLVKTDLEQDLIQFSVIDNGIGIAAEQLQKLFQPFVQVDSQLNRQYEGTGLGLALVQRLTDSHGGSVHVESELGKGSCFTVNLPLGKARVAENKIIGSGDMPVIDSRAEMPSSSSEDAASRSTILLAEDNMANVLTIGEYLESYDYQIIVAHDGLEAIDKAQESNPNIILMDIQMPAMDGLEAIRRLRANVRFTSTPIIALTALAMPGDRERCLKAGANEYMSKPVSLKSLVKAIKDLV